MSESQGVEGAAAPSAPVGTSSAPTTGPSANNGAQPQGNGDNPAWNELLGLLPSQFHNIVKPHLQKWDQGVQQRFQQVHSQYEPWKGFIDAGFSPDDINYSLGIMNLLNENPQGVYDALAEHLGIGSDGEQGEAEEEEGEEYVDPRIQELEQGYQNLAQITLAQHQAQEDAQADSELDEYLAELTSKFGEYDERYVLALMGSGMDGEEAVQQFQSLIENAKVQQNRPPSPTVLSPGGGLPSQQINPSQLDSKGRKNMVAQMLQQAAQEQNRP